MARGYVTTKANRKWTDECTLRTYASVWACHMESDFVPPAHVCLVAVVAYFTEEGLEEVAAGHEEEALDGGQVGRQLRLPRQQAPHLPRHLCANKQTFVLPTWLQSQLHLVACPAEVATWKHPGRQGDMEQAHMLPTCARMASMHRWKALWFSAGCCCRRCSAAAKAGICPFGSQDANDDARQVPAAGWHRTRTDLPTKRTACAMAGDTKGGRSPSTTCALPN